LQESTISLLQERHWGAFVLWGGKNELREVPYLIVDIKRPQPAQRDAKKGKEEKKLIFFNKRRKR